MCGRILCWRKCPPKLTWHLKESSVECSHVQQAFSTEDSTVLLLASCLRKNGTSFPHWAKNPEKLKVDTPWQDQGVLTGIVHCSPPQQAAMLNILGLCPFQGAHNLPIFSYVQPLESNIAGCDINPAFKFWLTNGCCCCLQSVCFPKRWFDISKFDTVSDECHVLAFLCDKLFIIQGLQHFLVFTRQLIVIVQSKGGIDVLQIQVPFRLMTPKSQIYMSIPVAGAKFVNIWAAIQLLLFPPSCRAWRCFASMMRNDIEEEYLWNTQKNVTWELVPFWENRVCRKDKLLYMSQRGRKMIDKIIPPFHGTMWMHTVRIIFKSCWSNSRFSQTAETMCKLQVLVVFQQWEHSMETHGDQPGPLLNLRIHWHEVSLCVTWQRS